MISDDIQRPHPAEKQRFNVLNPDDLEQRINEASHFHEYDIDDQGNVPDHSHLPCHAELFIDPLFCLPESEIPIFEGVALMETKADFKNLAQDIVDLISQIERVNYATTTINKLTTGYSFRFTCDVSRESDSSSRDPNPRAGVRQRGVFAVPNLLVCCD